MHVEISTYEFGVGVGDTIQHPVASFTVTESHNLNFIMSACSFLGLVLGAGWDIQLSLQSVPHIVREKAAEDPKLEEKCYDIKSASAILPKFLPFSLRTKGSFKDWDMCGVEK
jgi:hypothetical protein